MRQEITNNQLMLLRDDIQEQSKSPAFFFFNKEKINRFFKQNKVCLDILGKKIPEIKMKHCEMDPQGKPLTVKHDDNRVELLYKDKEAQDACATELTEFLNRSIRLEL